MTWGANTRKRVLEAIRIIRQIRNESFIGQINVAVYWNGNELVGAKGNVNEMYPPYRMALGRSVDNMETIQSEYLQSQMHSQYLWSLAYRPFGSGTFVEDKTRALMELMIARESSDLSIFRELWEQIRDEAGMAPTSTPRRGVANAPKPARLVH